VILLRADHDGREAQGGLIEGRRRSPAQNVPRAIDRGAAILGIEGAILLAHISAPALHPVDKFAGRAIPTAPERKRLDELGPEADWPIIFWTATRVAIPCVQWCPR
jgi:hypothetical protein